MKSLFILVAICFSTIAQAQLGINTTAGFPNGLELGLDYQPIKYVRVGANYGYGHYAQNINLKVSAGLPFLYAYGAANRLSTTALGQTTLSNLINETIEQEMDMSDPNQRHFYENALKTNQRDFQIVDLGLSGGIGLKAGWFFLEGGIRTTQFKNTAHDKVDLFINRVYDYIDDNYSQFDPRYHDFRNEVQQVETEVHQAIDDGAQQVPGGFRFLPEVKIGLRIPIGR